MTNNIDDLANLINEQLEHYGQLAQEKLEEAMETSSKELQAKLKQDSPKGKRKKYFRGWKLKRGKNKITVYNSQYQLTHLLEHGHILRNGGRSRAFPHIAPNEEKAVRQFLEEIERALRP